MNMEGGEASTVDGLQVDNSAVEVSYGKSTSKFNVTFEEESIKEKKPTYPNFSNEALNPQGPAQSNLNKKDHDKLAKNKNRTSQKKQDIHDLKKEMDMDEHRIDLDELLLRLDTDKDRGLTMEEARERLKRDGLNLLTPPKETPKCVKLMKQLFGGFAALLWLGAALCIGAYIITYYVKLENDMDQIWLAIVLILVVVVSGLFSYFQEAKGSKIMESFKNMIPPCAVVIRDGQQRNVLAEELVVGDVVEVKGGDGVPADIRIIICYGMKVDNSALTGEPEPMLRSEECTDDNPLETKNLAFFSTNCVEGQGRGIVVATGDNTVMGRIACLVTGVKSEMTPMKREINKFIHMITIFAVSLGTVLSIAYGVLSGDSVQAIVFFIGIIVANVPEGLLPTVTVALTITAKRMAKKFCLVKNLEAVETLGSTSVICSDKTGTLTQNRMTVAHMWCDNVTTDCDISEAQEFSAHQKAENQAYQRLMRCVTLCNRAAFKPDQDHLPILQRETIADASESALFKFTELVYGSCVEYRTRNTKIVEIPFNSANKYQLSIHVKEKPISRGKPGDLLLCMKGAPEQIMERCATIYADGRDQPVTPEWKEMFSIAYAKLGGLGERVLGFADLNLTEYNKDFRFETEPEPNFPTTGLRFLGLVTLIDPPRPSVPDAVAKCQKAGVRIIMVTGDHPITAAAIARSVGIISAESETIDEVAARMDIPIIKVQPETCRAAVIHGHDLKELSDDQLDVILNTHHEIVFARTSPQQKLIIVEGCQRNGSIVAVTGDGVNDSPALKKADIGVAMGIAGTEVSKQAADMILLDDNFSSIVTGIEEGRIIFDNIKKVIAYVLTSNMPEMIPFIIYVFIGSPLPLGTITILFIDLGTDIIPCIAMAYECGEADVMERMPRNPKKDLLVTREMFYVSYGIAGFIETAGGFLAWFIVMAQCGWWPADLIGIRETWSASGDNSVKDSYEQEWTYSQRSSQEMLGQTVFFLAIVLGQIANAVQGRTRIVSTFKHPCYNKMLPLAILSEVVVAAVLTYIPYVNEGLKFRVARVEWIFIAFPFAMILIAFQEVRKWFIRRGNVFFVRNMRF